MKRPPDELRFRPYVTDPDPDSDTDSDSDSETASVAHQDFAARGQPNCGCCRAAISVVRGVDSLLRSAMPLAALLARQIRVEMQLTLFWPNDERAPIVVN